MVPGSKIKLKDIDPRFKDHHENHKDAAEEIEQDRKKLRELQELLYANSSKWAENRDFSEIKYE